MNPNLYSPSYIEIKVVDYRLTVNSKIIKLMKMKV